MRRWSFVDAAGEAASLTLEPVATGPTLANWAADLGRPLDQGEIDGVAAALLDGLEALHRAGAPHGAVDAAGSSSPTPARCSPRAAPGRRTVLSRTAIDADIGALAHVLNDLIGAAPATAYRPEFMQAVTLALAGAPGSRPPSIAAFRELLFDDPTATDPAEPPEPEPLMPRFRRRPHRRSPPSGGCPGCDRHPVALRVRRPRLCRHRTERLTQTVAERPAPGLARPPAEATASAVPAPTPPPTPSLQERIAASSDRAELLRIAQAAPALQEAVEARLRTLGLVRVAGREQVYWLQPGGGERFRECSDCPEMVVVPAGSFRMGPLDEADRLEDEDDRRAPAARRSRSRSPRPSRWRAPRSPSANSPPS